MPDIDAKPEQSRHVVVVVGGAVAGSEAAAVCARRGAFVVVLEQGDKPFGKIEDGLPRWHEKLRVREYELITKNLTHPDVALIPRTALGRDIRLADLVQRWQVSAVLLGSGAWRDRPLFAGAEGYYGLGLIPQNAFVHWYNHYPERGYDGPTFHVPDGAIVVGGGLASIDVAKIINLELYKRVLRERGHHFTTLELEHEGIAPVLAKLGLTPEALGVRGVTLYYRREKSAMPIASAPDDATEEQVHKVEHVRERLMDKVIERYLVHFEGNRALHAPIIENGQVRGLLFKKTRTLDHELVTLADEPIPVRSALIVSSIGSIPQPVEGVPMRGELIDFADLHTGRVAGFDAVFGLGNALTGKGNIKDSRRNATFVSTQMAESFLGLREELDLVPEIAARVEARAAVVADQIDALPLLDAARVAAIRREVRTLQERVGFHGDLAAWLAYKSHPAHET